MNATFVPNFDLTLSQAAVDCGFTNFDWQQMITNWRSPDLIQNGNPIPLTAPPAFLDPPLGGYNYCVPRYGSPCDGYPFYWNPNTTGMNWSLNKRETGNTLSFIDVPADLQLPAGGFLGFTTQLVGIVPNGTPSPLPEQWTWIDTYNGTSGGIPVTATSFRSIRGAGPAA